MTAAKPRLVLLGKQGAGKGTQAARVADHYGLSHISTGDMFRAQAAQGTAFGLEAKRYMDAGELVPDEIVIGVIEECLVPGGPLADGFVLDGFPRTLHQAEELDRVLAGSPLDLAINLEVPREIVIDRIAGRRVCENCQRLYHVNMRPTKNWTCDTCGGDVRQRDDDTEEAVERRLELYEQETVPIIDHYAAKGLLVPVDGVGEGDEVFERLIKVVDDHVTSRR
jgi:adenylate kinase